MMTSREWKTQALWYIKRALAWQDSPYRREREYANYIKRFLFGDGEITFDGNNETWKRRKAERTLPMPTNIYMIQ